jgi:hypothetical protein
METAPTDAVYQRVGVGPVVLLDRNRKRMRLEQGLGLRPGTRFSVTGFTDTADDDGYDTMQVTSASLTFAPASSDNDSDGNLLDDEWEKFFFGAIGQDPYSEPSPGYSLLQYFLDGVDPRGSDTPSGPAVTLAPLDVAFSPAADGTFVLEFTFPDEYASYYEFALETSSTLGGGTFSEIPGAVFTLVGPNRYRVTISAADAADSSAFYRVRLSLL